MQMTANDAVGLFCSSDPGGCSHLPCIEAQALPSTSMETIVVSRLVVVSYYRALTRPKQSKTLHLSSSCRKGSAILILGRTFLPILVATLLLPPAYVMPC